MLEVQYNVSPGLINILGLSYVRLTETSCRYVLTAIHIFTRDVRAGIPKLHLLLGRLHLYKMPKRHSFSQG
jgi:hypothetical protein